MATVLELITGAAIELNARPMGTVLSSAESARGLVVVQSMYTEAVDKGVFGRVEEYLADDDYEAEEQQRVYSAGFTITLPTTITGDDGADRRPLDLALIEVVNDGSSPQRSVYDALFGDWVRLDSLTLVSTAPFSERNRHALECALAVRLQGTFQKQAPPSTSAAARELGQILSQRYGGARRQTVGSYF